MTENKNYVAEFATDRINDIKNNVFMVSYIKNNAITAIKSALERYNKGLISTKDAMLYIANA